MQIWLIERDEDIGYDEWDAKVVVAETEQAARELAALDTADEGKTVWFDQSRCVATVIGTADDPSPRVILGSLNAG